MRVDTVFVTTDATQRFEEIVGVAHGRAIPVIPVVDTVLSAMAETTTPQGILAVCEIPTVTLGDVVRAEGSGPLVILDGVADPGNAGTIIRTADAFGAVGVILTEGSVDPYNGKCVRSTAGSIFNLPVTADASAEEARSVVRDAGFPIAVATGHGDVDLADWAHRADGRWCWVFGSEAHGVGPLLTGSADARVRIPIVGRAESLNVASAAAVCLSADLDRRRGRIEASPSTGAKPQ